MLLEGKGAPECSEGGQLLPESVLLFNDNTMSSAVASFELF